MLQWLQAHPQAKLLSTWPVATEVCALLAWRIHNEAALDFLRWAQRDGIGPDSPGDLSLADVLAISERFASLPFDLAVQPLHDQRIHPVQVRHRRHVAHGFQRLHRGVWQQPHQDRQ